MVNLSVLVLNQNYVPLNVCNVRRAVRLLYKGKAEMLENGQGDLHTISKLIPMPSVIRLSYTPGSRLGNRDSKIIPTTVANTPDNIVISYIIINIAKIESIGFPPVTNG